MKKNFLQATTLFLVGGLVLTGCADASVDGANGGNGNQTVPALSYPEKWNNQEVAEMLFPRGDYSFTYREVNSADVASSWSGTGQIAFYENGTCAFDFSGVKSKNDGSTESYRLGKLANGSVAIRQTDETSGEGYWNTDQLAIESEYRTNFPAMAAFPRFRDFSSFCALQRIQDLTLGGGAEFGFLRWDVEKGEAFAKEGKEWFFDHSLHFLDISQADREEALKVLELMYYAPNNIFTYDGDAKVEVRENGEVLITTGKEGETEVYAEFILTPVAQKIAFDFSDIGGSKPVNVDETMTAYIEYYKSGIDYLREINKQYENAPKPEGSDTAPDEGTTEETPTEESDN